MLANDPHVASSADRLTIVIRFDRIVEMGKIAFIIAKQVVDLGDFETRKWEMGFAAGDFNGARTIDGYLAYGLTPNISLRITGTQILGNFSDGLMGTVNVVMYPFPEWRVSPYFTVGTGIIHTEPQTTVVQAEDRTDEIANAGVGANIYLTRRFVMNFEYRRHTVLTSRDDNQEINEWKTGFSVFLGKH